MKVLIMTKKDPSNRFLVKLHTDRLVGEIAALIAKKRYSQAAAVALAKGRIEREVSVDDIKKVKADLIIEESAVV